MVKISKPMCDITTHLIEWLKIKILTTPRCDEDVEEPGSPDTVGG